MLAEQMGAGVLKGICVADKAIFVLAEGRLASMIETPYDNEAILQKVLKDFPDLLAGAATTGESGRLLFVRREMPVADCNGEGSLSLDHLFVDSAGVPVLVEVKRSTDTRARREVVAQMLDYAAGGVAYWPADRLRTLVEEAAAARGVDPSEVLLRELGVEDEPDRFWRVVEDNLRTGRVRLIFLADRLHEDLVRIIEFLNGQMRDTEVLGVELPQYTGAGDVVVYVPQVVGRTTVAVDTKRGGGASGARWTRESMLDTARGVCTPGELAFLERLLDHVASHGGRYGWGKAIVPGVTGRYVVEAVDTPMWNISIGAAPGKGVFYFSLPEYAARHPGPRLDRYAAAVSKIGQLAEQVRKVEAGNWRNYVRLPLAEAAARHEEVLAAVETALS